MEYERIDHPLEPIYDENSLVLILGSFLPRLTRQMGYPYGHPQNRFWPVLARVLGEALPVNADAAERRTYLLRHHIALWDVIRSTDIIGSSDASIRNEEPTDLLPIVESSKIRAVFCNGQASFKAYRQYHEPVVGIEAVSLPSTSPANAAWSLDRLTEAWQVIRHYLTEE